MTPRFCSAANLLTVSATRELLVDDREFQPLIALAAAVEMHENRPVARERYIGA